MQIRVQERTGRIGGFLDSFGGSKLIQEQRLSERCISLPRLFSSFWLSVQCRVGLAMQQPMVCGYYALIIMLGIAYSLPPMKLSYRRLGEVVIFFAFRAGDSDGGYYIQTGIFPDAKVFFVPPLWHRHHRDFVCQ